MKTPKKQSKEQPLPTQDEARRTNVLLEKIMSDFRTVAEGQSLLREDVNNLKPRFDTLEEKVIILDISTRSHTNAINANTEAIRALKSDLNNINHRLEVVETKVAS